MNNGKEEKEEEMKNKSTGRIKLSTFSICSASFEKFAVVQKWQHAEMVDEWHIIIFFTFYIVPLHTYIYMYNFTNET